MPFVYDFDHPHEADPDTVVELLGGKGANLCVMTRRLGLPVPPGFVISTEACRSYLTDGWPDGLDEEIREHMADVEAEVGRRFGGSGTPLLVSVRSGAPVSMPGMMDTILNIGLNEETTGELAAVSGEPDFAAACRARLEKMFREVVGVDDVPRDPWDQLRLAIEAVFRSWDSPRAVAYREHEGLPADLGTGVTVQMMVFGNWGEDSGTGVVFTRNPATGDKGLYGDVMFEAQGEDVVSGSATPEPISALDDRMPSIAAELRGYADRLEQHYRDVCDIEFTIERGKLWMLQTRIGKRTPQAALKIAVDMARDEHFPLSRAEAVERVAEYLVDPPTVGKRSAQEVPTVARGLGASPGLASGVIVTSPDAAVERAGAGEDVILVRAETSPDDVHGMAKSRAILTSKGGLTSHAAVVARGWNIPAVVGASEVKINGDSVTMGGRTFAVGDVISIDGGSGEVYAGAVDNDPTPTPEAELLLSWAEELGIDIGPEAEGADEVADHTTTGAQGEAPDADTVIRVLFVKGFATSDLLAPAVLSSEGVLEGTLEEMTEAGLVRDTSGMHSLTEDGKARGQELMAEDREHWGDDAANEALDAFIPLDNRMKEIVTSWQMREVEGEQVINDHTDEDYDREVLEQFTSLHEDAASWLDGLRDGLPRLGDYATRLQRAADLVSDGDHSYIASPRVDSYHSVWFELHEDLIRLAGRTREDEAAAGRA